MDRHADKKSYSLYWMPFFSSSQARKSSSLEPINCRVFSWMYANTTHTGTDERGFLLAASHTAANQRRGSRPPSVMPHYHLYETAKEMFKKILTSSCYLLTWIPSFSQYDDGDANVGACEALPILTRP